MELLHFKCKVCDDYHDMDRSLPEAFSGWAYAQMLWTDLTDQIPPLSEAFTGSSRTPQAGESRVVKVQLPFTESVGMCFTWNFCRMRSFCPLFI